MTAVRVLAMTDKEREADGERCGARDRSPGSPG